jgi:hypothetical protein
VQSSHSSVYSPLTAVQQCGKIRPMETLFVTVARVTMAARCSGAEVSNLGEVFFHGGMADEYFTYTNYTLCRPRKKERWWPAVVGLVATLMLLIAGGMQWHRGM